MTFVITPGCCSDASCIAVCPVQCIRPRPGDPDFTGTDQLYVDPNTCIDCGACEDECPVDAVRSEWDLPEELAEFTAINAEYFEANPLVGPGPPSLVQRSLPPGHTELRVAIVGSGPAACYAAEVLAEIDGVEVTILERLPTPFGLVRTGVAPDHGATKAIEERFAQTLRRSNVTCYFNVDVGRDVTLEELLDHHHAVIWAGGARGDRQLGIPGEDMAGVHAARDLVGWYNGHPEHVDDAPDLTGDRAVVLGNGNVALDVARVLLRSTEDLQQTETADHALSALADSSVREVVVVGRRGPEHAAFSFGELEALGRVDGIDVRTEAGEIAELDSGRVRDILMTAAGKPDSESRVVRLRFGLEPLAITGGERVKAVEFRRADGSAVSIEASLVVRAIGYRGTPVDGIPFDDVMGTLPHDAGRVVDPARGEPVVGMYCSGWIKRGPRGVIGTNRHDAEETVASILHDVGVGRLRAPQQPLGELDRTLRQRVPDLVDASGWARIDAAERERGHSGGRPRVKLVTILELLHASRLPREPTS